MKKIELKDKVKCLMTGRVGVVYGIAEYVYNSTQFYVLFEEEKKAQWISSPQLEFYAAFDAETDK